jgi:cob(I)alamin adenosyltransferase
MDGQENAHEQRVVPSGSVGTPEGKRTASMVTLSRIYTRTGDSGETGLGDGNRISKASLRITAIGAVDETNSAIGIARLDAEGDTDAMLSRIQNDLFDLGADLSAPEDGRKAEGRLRISGAQVERLEREIDAMNEKLSPLTSFVLPGGTALAARLHLARAIARRAEAAMVALATEEKINALALCYANRLSDHLFVLARTANDSGMGDMLWIPGEFR